MYVNVCYSYLSDTFVLYGINREKHNEFNDLLMF